MIFASRTDCSIQLHASPFVHCAIQPVPHFAGQLFGAVCVLHALLLLAKHILSLFLSLNCMKASCQTCIRPLAIVFRVMF